MVTSFGWSAGDIATAVRAIYKITQAFREAGGASEQYAETVTFLEALALTLNRLKEYIDSNSSGKYKNNIEEQARLIKVEYDKLHKHIQEYHRLASSTSTQNQVKEAREKLKWAIDQLRDKVSKMKDGVSVPLQFLHTFLSLQILDDIKGVDRRLNEVSDTVRSNDSSLKDAIGSQQILLAAIRTGLEGKITEEAESLRQSQNAHSTNTLDALQQLSRDLRSTQDSIHRRLGQLDPADLLMELNEQRELILKMRDAVDSHLLDLLYTLKIHETKKRSPEWLPLVQTACTAFAAVIGVANFVLQRSMASNLKPSNGDEGSQPKTTSNSVEPISEDKAVTGEALEEDPTIANLNAEQDAKPKKILQPHPFDDSTESDVDIKTSNDPADEPQEVPSASFSTLSIMPTLAGETSEPSLSSKSRLGSSPDCSTANDAGLRQGPVLIANAESDSQTQRNKNSIQYSSIASYTKQSRSSHHSESRNLESSSSGRSSSSATKLSRPRPAPEYDPRYTEPTRSSQNYSSYTTSPYSGFSGGGGGGYSTSSYYSSYSPPSRPTYHQTYSTPDPSSRPSDRSSENTWSYPLTAYSSASARITAPTPSRSTPYHTAPSTTYGGPPSISTTESTRQQGSTTAKNGSLWFCCSCKDGPLVPFMPRCLNCGHLKCAECELKEA